MKVLKCNKCGRNLLTENDIPKEDFLYIRKEWGYFSKKDGICHQILLCENCYDEIVNGFAIPPTEVEITELL